MRWKLWPIVVVACVALAACAGGGPGRISYLAVGASDAAGVGAVPPTQGYTYRIRNELDERVDEVPFVNLGLPGADVAAIERAVEGVLATDREPDLVTLWAGPNDVIRGDDADDFEGDLEDILE